MSDVITLRAKKYTAPNGVQYLVTEDGELFRYVKSSKNPQTTYRHTTLGRNNPVAVHRLVCEVWHGPKPFDDAVVRHLDGDRWNNSASNLCWGTQKENMEDCKRHGNMPVGANRHNSKLTEKDVLEIRSHKKEYGLWRRLSQKYGVSEMTIGDVWHRRTWQWL